MRSICECTHSRSTSVVRLQIRTSRQCWPVVKRGTQLAPKSSHLATQPPKSFASASSRSTIIKAISAGSQDTPSTSDPGPAEPERKVRVPLLDAVRTRSERNGAAFHVPGHKRGEGAGRAADAVLGPAVLQHDLTELAGLDCLSEATGVIGEAQALAAQAFGAHHTWFLVNGTTVGIHAAILATCRPGDAVILARNCHQSAFFACILAGVTPHYADVSLDPQLGVAHDVTAHQVHEAILQARTELTRQSPPSAPPGSGSSSPGPRVGAVIIVSPTYYGVCSDVAEIAATCDAHGVPLIVDEAHGAHFGLHAALPPSALQQGADVAVQSTHKVLSSLTQASMLHVGGTARVCARRISRALLVLQSSSPSYPLMCSLDAARAQVQADGPDSFLARGLRLAGLARERLARIPGVRQLSGASFAEAGRRVQVDPLRLTLQVDGFTGYRLDAVLDEQHNVQCELAGPRSVTLVITGGNTDADVDSLVAAIQRLADSSPSSSTPNGSTISATTALCTTMLSSDALRPRAVLTPREAFFADTECVDYEQACGRTSAELLCPYPPGIPMVAPGQELTKPVLCLLRDVLVQGGRVNGAADPSLATLVVVANAPSPYVNDLNRNW